ncbi:MAG TPA: POTRA domain-containing protein, partial [Bacteroidota bacterium]|nr:POTRA domain-containing protein [Bacteroidota bacterium]
MKLFLFCVLLLSSLISIAFSQESDSLRSLTSSTNESDLTVKEVIIRGNEQTKDFIILREMTLKPGSRITPELLDYDKNRIYSLGLFNQVQLDIVTKQNGSAQLVVDVSERWYIFPFPIAGIKDRDWNKFYYGVGFLHNNFRGRNEKLYGSVVLGYNPSIGLGYRNPFLAEDGSYFLEIQFGYNISRNKSIQALSGQENFDERNLGASTTIGRRFGIAHTTWLSIGYQQVSISDYYANRTISSNGRDRFPVMNVGYSFDTRDLKEYPSNGTLAIVTVKKTGIPEREIDFIRY